MQPSDSPSTTRTTRTTPSEPMAPMLYQSIHTLLHTVATKVKSPPSQALAQSYLCVCAAEIKICWPRADKKAQTLQSSPRTSHRGADRPPRPIRFCPGFPLCPSWFLRPLSSFSEHAIRAVLSTGMRLVPSPFAKILSLLASFLSSLFPIVHFSCPNTPQHKKSGSVGKLYDSLRSVFSSGGGQAKTAKLKCSARFLG